MKSNESHTEQTLSGLSGTSVSLSDLTVKPLINRVLFFSFHAALSKGLNPTSAKFGLGFGLGTCIYQLSKYAWERSQCPQQKS